MGVTPCQSPSFSNQGRNPPQLSALPLACVRRRWRKRETEVPRERNSALSAQVPRSWLRLGRGGLEDSTFGFGHSDSYLGSTAGRKAFVRVPAKNKAREIPNGVHDFQAEPQRPVLQHPVLRLLPCPHRDDYLGDLVHGKGGPAGQEGRALGGMRMSRG